MKNEKTVPYNLRLPNKLKSKLEKQAKEESRSLNKHIVHVLELCANGKVEKREVVSA
jgi:predicted HicB family RNase H-like nuclease